MNSQKRHSDFFQKQKQVEKKGTHTSKIFKKERATTANLNEIKDKSEINSDLEEVKMNFEKKNFQEKSTKKVKN